LRNYIAQNAVDAAEQGDYSEVRRLLTVLEHPYDDVATDVEADGQPNTYPGTSQKLIWGEFLT
jgi:uncharacterized protein YdiU (UPF0061 family)